MSLDKFYTKENISRECIDFLLKKINIKDFDIIVEPSAGNGSFSNILFDMFENVEAYDIEPEEKRVKKMDFFDFVPNHTKKYITIGNPPFGRVSSLAVKFFEKAATFSDVIAFIIPRTFKRVSVKNRLNKFFHLEYEFDIPEKSFYPEMNAKCCFQVWVKKENKREEIKLNDKTADFNILKIENRHNASFAIRAYGSKCGEISYDISNLAPRSWHFIESKNPEKVISIIENLDFSISKDTARQDSIGAREFIHLYNNTKSP